MITREADYGIRALMYLARQPEGTVVSTTVLAEAMEIPYRFLRRIMLKLSAQGMVKTVRGKQGGIILARDPATITLLTVVRAIDPDVVTLNACLVEPHHCTRSAFCEAHAVLQRIQAELDTSLASVTLADLASEARRITEHTS